MKKNKKSGITTITDTLKLGATVAALGISLGVNFDAAYAETGPGNDGSIPPAGAQPHGDSGKDSSWNKANSGQYKFGSQDKQKGKSNQIKLGANQQKARSNQLKATMIKKEASQIKLDANQIKGSGN